MGVNLTEQDISCPGPFKLTKLIVQKGTSSISLHVLVGILQRSPELVEFDAKGSTFNDRCCEALAACPNLEVVKLAYTNVSSAGT